MHRYLIGACIGFVVCWLLLKYLSGKSTSVPNADQLREAAPRTPRVGLFTVGAM
jgi:hypothetical protein